MRSACWGLLIISLLCLSSSAGAVPFVHDWSQLFGDGDWQDGHGVAVDGNGNVIVTGFFWGLVNFGGDALANVGNSDIFLAKLDAGGNHVWSRRFGDASNDGSEGWDVAVDASGNVALAGRLDGTVDFGGGVLTSAGGHDIFVAKFDAGGNHLWSHVFGDASNQDVYDVAVDGSGSVVVTGNFLGTVDFGGGSLTSAGGEDIFVAKFDAAGSHVWSQRFGAANLQNGESVAIDASGNVVVTGSFLDSVDFGGGPLTSDTGVDIFVAKFDPAGNHVWSQRFGDRFDQVSLGVAVDASGNLILTGFFLGTVDFGGGPLSEPAGYDVFLAKLDAAGSHVWSKSFGDAGSQFGLDVAVDASGNAVVTGQFSGSVDFGGGLLPSTGLEDIFVARFDAGGNHLWSQHYGAAFEQSVGSAVAVHASGNAVVTGIVNGEVDFGGGPMTSAGDQDIFVLQLTPDISTGVGAEETPRASYLMQNTPNPFGAGTTISFDLPREADVSLRVYDASGRLVRVLVDGHRGPGLQTADWNGEDESRRRVPSGVYFCRLETGSEIFTRKLVVLR
jgi:hypothetical protein